MMPSTDRYTPPQNTIKELTALLDANRGLAAWEIVKNLPPLANWRSFEGRQLAAKLAAALGNHRLGSILDWYNWREHPDNHRAYFRALFARFQYKASSLLLPEMEARIETVDAPSEVYSDLLALCASCHTDVREFTTAHELLDKAMQHSTDPSWLWVQRCLVYQKQDRYDDALESVNEGKKIKPNYRPVVEAHAATLINLGRDDEAREALIEASRHTDSPSIPLHLSNIFSDLDDVEQTSHWLDEYERKSPLLDPNSRRWLAGRRADICYLAGDTQGFLDFAAKTKKKSFQHRCLEYYQEHRGVDGARKRLDVRFVRQHDMTCAPATIAALTAYFGKPHDHLAIAEAICYHGTPWHKERNWCEDHGFAVCEFPVTMEATKALIDADIPFSLTTQSIDSGHLQACIGYDEKLGLILLRDPTLRHYGEAILSRLQEEHPIVGLRGLALVPEEMKSQLDALQISGQRPYDLYHQFSCALDENQDGVVDHVLAQFRNELAEHPLYLHAEYRLAARNRHLAVELQYNEKLTQHAPKHQALWLQKIRILEQLSRHTEARDFLSSVHRNPESDPLFDLEVGELLCRDVRSIDLGQFYLRRVLRQTPSNAQAHAAYATSLNVLGEREEALRFRRSASQLNGAAEAYARRYYHEASYLRQEKTALAYLRERATQANSHNIAPHLTLLDILAGKNDPEAPALAERLLKQFPDDGDLLLETVTLFSGWNRHDEARRHLQQAQNKVPRPAWLQVAARYWSWTGDRRKSRQCWEQLIELQAHNVTAYESVAQHLAEEQDREAAVEFLRQAYEAQPDYLPLLKSYIEWVEFSGPAESIQLLEKAIELDPLDIWAIRELALKLSKDSQHEKAEQTAREALAFDHSDEASHCVLGLVLEAARKIDEAAAAFQSSLELNIDHTASFNGLLRIKDTFAERQATLEFVRRQMLEQVSTGDIVSEYRMQATGVVAQDELENDLKQFHQARPDLWQTWSALREHYHATTQYDLELTMAKQLTEQFPLLPRSWVELAFAYRDLGRSEDEVTAFEKALELSPTWDWILRELSQALEALERFDEALVILDRAIQADPLVPGGYGYKADLLWKIGRPDEAIGELRKALEISPYYEWGWSRLIEWTRLEGQEDVVLALIAKIEKKRSHQWRWWMSLAEVYSELEQPEKALTAIDRGLAQNPLEISLLDRKAALLANLGRYPEAIACCQTSFENGQQPVRLQGREAWVLMSSGRGSEAWDRMQAISESEPDYYFAHHQLANWAYNTDSYQQLKQAATRMIALNPDEHESWGYLGIAEEELNQTQAALEAYSRALVVHPSYLFAARRKADLELKADRPDEAESTLQRMQFHHPNSFIIVDLLAIDLHRCARRLTPAIRKRWEQLSIVSAKLDEDPYYQADYIFKEANLNSLYGNLQSESAKACAFRSPAEARAWGRQIRISSRRQKLLKQSLKSALSDRYKASVMAEVMRGHPNDVPAKEVEALIKKHGPLLDRYHDSWAAVLNYYTEISNASKACQHGALWRNFLTELEPSTLAGYASFVDETQGLNAGFAVRKSILEEFPQWEGTKYLRAGYAFRKATTGDADEAEDLISGYMERHSPHDFYDILYHHTLANIAAHRGDAAGCEKHFTDAVNCTRKFPKDETSLCYLRASADSCARSLDLFGGNSKKLLKRWARGLDKQPLNIPTWLIFLLIYFAIKALIALSK
ncbi:tetratricopeptide repeat protein [Verrucomicrobiaceae bacterium R5-34]|nr:tetratricopeptide repeat protein [Verrucomicrobiaceae bacterium R5-34]